VEAVAVDLFSSHGESSTGVPRNFSFAVWSPSSDISNRACGEPWKLSALPFVRAPVIFIACWGPGGSITVLHWAFSPFILAILISPATSFPATLRFRMTNTLPSRHVPRQVRKRNSMSHPRAALPRSTATNKHVRKPLGSMLVLTPHAVRRFLCSVHSPATLSTSLPKFSPRNSFCSVSGKVSRPSTMSSRAFNLPESTQPASACMPSAYRAA
jgi:hypothetical protein